MKRKYLHVEMSDGSLFVFADNKQRYDEGYEAVTLEAMDMECRVSNVDEDYKCTIPLKGFI